MGKKRDNNYLYITSKLKYFIFLCIYYLLYPLCHVLYGKKNNWLICERGDDAQDNGYVFFKYIVEKQKEIKPVYLIRKSSTDYDKVASVGRVIEFGSIKHFLMMIGFPVKISSHLFGYSPWVQSTLYYRRHQTFHKHIFLQHGITKNYHEGLLANVCKSLDLFICGAKPEYEFINCEFNYHNQIPQYTGLPRYDLLNDFKCKNQILYMPTWRAKLSHLSDDEFVKSPFYKNWNNLINNEHINDLCKANNISIKFYLHYSLQRFLHLFNSNTTVKIISFREESVQQLLKESMLLVTDFSSVFFDFGYMNKPLVYFQFDEDTFYDEHYSRGYFDYRRDGFGDVVLKVNDVYNSIKLIFVNSFKMEDKYVERTKEFFILDKNHNCDRVFDAILNIINKKG